MFAFVLFRVGCGDEERHIFSGKNLPDLDHCLDWNILLKTFPGCFLSFALSLKFTQTPIYSYSSLQSSSVPLNLSINSSIPSPSCTSSPYLSQVVWYDRSGQDQQFRSAHSWSAPTCQLAGLHQPFGSTAALLHTSGSAAQMGQHHRRGLWWRDGG